MVHFLDYIESNNFDLNNVCRICLIVKKGLVSLSDSVDEKLNNGSDDTLIKMLTSLMSIQLVIDDSMPNQICKDCVKELKRCTKFRALCEISESTLKSVLKGEYVKDEHSISSGNSPLSCYIEEERSTTEPLYNVKHEFGKEQEKTWEEDHSNSQMTTKVKTEIIKVEKDSALQVRNNSSQSVKNKKKKFSHINIKQKRKPNKKLNSINFMDKESNSTPHDGKNKKRYMCNLCSEEFTTSISLEDHVAKSHSMANFRCSDCEKCYFSQKDLDIHSAMHSDLLRCPECQKEFTLKSRLARHIDRHMSCKRHQCPNCPKAFSELFALHRHRRIHTGQAAEKRHACPHCDKRFPDAASLRGHALRHSGLRPCVCASCGLGFRTPRLLRSHARIHKPDKPYQCNYCDRRFRHASTWLAHERTHTGEQPYVCATCGRRFRHHSNMALHMRTHSGEKPYACASCDRKFAAGSALNAHRRTHAAVVCTACGQKMTAGELRSHACQTKSNLPAVLTQTNKAIKKFECVSCPKKFSAKSQLTKHMKTHEQISIVTQEETDSQQMYILHGESENDSTPYNCTEEVIIPHEVPSENVIVDLSDTMPIEISPDEDIPTHVCLTQNGINFVNDLNVDSNVNVMTVSEGATVEGTNVMYRLDQSLLQIHSAGGQLTISKITSKMTANFD